MLALTALRDLARGPGVRYRTPPELRRKYRHLYETSVEPTPDGGARFGAARLWRRDGINVLYVTGDRFEMAFQHGRLLRDEIAAGTLRMAARMAHQGIRNSVGDGVLGRLVGWYADRLADTMLRAGRARAAERGEDSALEGYGLAEGSGVPVRTIMHAPLGPEVAQVLLGKTGTLALGAAAPNQCTSFAAWGEHTAGGELVIGRNTDYPLTGYYDAHPTAIYFEPADGSQRFMGVTSAGCHNVAVGGINEAGLYLATHTVPAATVSERGFPVMMVGQEVLRRATTLAEAKQLILEARPAAGWNYHVVSTCERMAMTFELSCAHIAERPSEGDWHVTTNHWLRPEMADHAMYCNATVEADTRARMARCFELIERAGGELDAAGAAAILADKYDRTIDDVRAGPNCVSATDTVSSSVWLPDRDALFVANGTAPVSQNRYVELPGLGAFDPDTFADADYETIECDRFRSSHPEMLAAEQLYQRAREAFEYDNDCAGAIELMDRALERWDRDPGMHLNKALYAARAGRFGTAREAADAVVALGTDPQRTRVARYLRGRIAAHTGDKPLALTELRAVAGDPQCCPRLADAARRCATKLTRRGRLPLRASELSPMSWMPDAFRYTGVSLFG